MNDLGTQKNDYMNGAHLKYRVYFPQSKLKRETFDLDSNQTLLSD